MTTDHMKHSVWTVCALVLLDGAVQWAPLLLGATYSYGIIRLAVHIALGVWVGFVLNRVFRAGGLESWWLVALYWVAFELSLFMLGGPFHLLQWGLAIWIVMKTRHAREDADGEASRTTADRRPAGPVFKRGKPPVWPAYAALLVLLAGLVLIGVVIGFDPSEFGALGMLFSLMFVTPAFLILPGLLRFPAVKRVKPVVEGVQVAVYSAVVVSWAIFLFRTYS